jgi:Mlc titration factor MtfA (ptsG expression regulator)
MGEVIQVDFGQARPPCSPDEYAEVISIVAELEPARAFAVLSNALFAVLLAKNGREYNALWRDLRDFHRAMRKLFLASQRIIPGT